MLDVTRKSLTNIEQASSQFLLESQTQLCQFLIDLSIVVTTYFDPGGLG